MEIIDFRVRFRTAHMLKPWNIDHPAPHFSQYIKLYKMESRLSEMSMHEFTENMHVQRVSKAVVCGGSIEDNNHMIDIKKSEYGSNYYYFAGIHPDYGVKKNLEELERCRKEGFLGATFVPYIWGVKANDKRLYPLYAYCEQYNLVATIHGAMHYNIHQSMFLGEPRFFDELAIDFPKLKIVVTHAFSGYAGTGLAVAQRHPNIYLDFSALWPKYLPTETMQAVNSYLKKKCLFGTSYPVVDFTPAIEAWKAALKPELYSLFFEENAMRCLLGEPCN